MLSAGVERPNRSNAGAMAANKVDRCSVSRRRVRAPGAVVKPPGRDLATDVPGCAEPVLVQAFVPQPAGRRMPAYAPEPRHHCRSMRSSGKFSLQFRSSFKNPRAVSPNGVMTYSTDTGDESTTLRLTRPWRSSWRRRSVIIFLLAPLIMRARSLKRTGSSFRCQRIEPVHLPPMIRIPRSMAHGSSQAPSALRRPLASLTIRACIGLRNLQFARLRLQKVY